MVLETVPFDAAGFLNDARSQADWFRMRLTQATSTLLGVLKALGISLHAEIDTGSEAA